jgi:4-hydroxy-tetrahydrodipicolinate reductase
MRLLLVGHGKMGRLVEALAPDYGFTVAGIVDPQSPGHAAGADDDCWRGVDVAVDFTVAEAVVRNAPALARRGVNLVIGTTGWQAHEAELRGAVEAAGVGAVAAPNFAIGVLLFEAIVGRAAELTFGAWLHEAHHAAKKDAPSGTALALVRDMRGAGYGRPIDVSSTRAGQIPGVHTIGFDGPSESITLSHTARDRSAFARGALEAARWVAGRRGWYTMRDVLGI